LVLIVALFLIMNFKLIIKLDSGFWILDSGLCT
jgi:hypothetical protein